MAPQEAPRAYIQGANGAMGIRSGGGAGLDTKSAEKGAREPFPDSIYLGEY